MKKSIKISLILSAMLLLMAFYASSALAADAKTISVTGSGKIMVVPDIVYYSVGINTQTADVSAGVADNLKQMEALKKALIQNGIGEKDITDSYYNVYSQNDPNDYSKVTYTISNSCQVTLRDVSKMSGMYKIFTDNGVNTISQISYDSSTLNDAYDQARNAAIDDAAAKAQKVADKLGVKLAGVNSFDSNSEYSDNGIAYGMGGNSQMGGGAETSTNNQMAVTSQVVVTYNFTEK